MSTCPIKTPLGSGEAADTKPHPRAIPRNTQGHLFFTSWAKPLEQNLPKNKQVFDGLTPASQDRAIRGQRGREGAQKTDQHLFPSLLPCQGCGKPSKYSFPASRILARPLVKLLALPGCHQYLLAQTQTSHRKANSSKPAALTAMPLSLLGQGRPPPASSGGGGGPVEAAFARQARCRAQPLLCK